MKAHGVKFTPARRFVTDLSTTALSVPLGVIKRTINIAPARTARATAAKRMPWTIMLARAFGIVAARTPPLRQAYVKFPWPRLVEFELSICMIMIERQWQSETLLVPAKIKFPGERPMTELAKDLEAVLRNPVEANSHLRLVHGFNRLAWPLRRLAWWLAFNAGLWRAIYFGTFGISVLGHTGASIVRPISPVTTFLSLGPFAENGDVELTIGFDHRVMDGGLIAQVMIEIEAELNGAVATELANLKG